MVTYTQQELVGITELGKSLGSFIEKFHQKQLKNSNY